MRVLPSAERDTPRQYQSSISCQVCTMELSVPFDSPYTKCRGRAISGPAVWEHNIVHGDEGCLEFSPGGYYRSAYSLYYSPCSIGKESIS